VLARLRYSRPQRRVRPEQPELEVFPRVEWLEGAVQQVGPGLRVGRAGEASNLHVPVPHLVAVILDEDVARLERAEPRDVLELAVGNRLLQRRAVQLLRQHPSAVQIMLDRRAHRDDAAGVPFAGRLEFPIPGLEHVVKIPECAVIHP
jgi:hypothetical protein